ncbi:ATP-binding cassette domain-containing protein [Algoriphagus lacus]|uniref:ATP-binding cassette domain-containing protein n=1 Tax=Algoriphagus lacus TaxID=2056311 RepID=A0A418PRD3_9BACT|nr:ATP-binding cassette domain-containing protein [Algoriphagus lacus]RIW15172.1 ATP-binding cassette domain-containing protein [Algoriphagus lacus]
MKDKLLIDIQSARVQQGGIGVFEALDFAWKKGQHWAIISNSGKELTAFLETLRGNTVVSSGEITRHFASSYLQKKNLDGQVHSFRDLMSYVSQKYELKNRSNQQNFYFQQRFNSNKAEDASTVKEYLQQVQPHQTGPWTLEKTTQILNLSHLLDQSLLKLSNGETRRLVLALGLMRQPMIYLMDQPMTGLDAQTRAEFGGILRAIIQAGVHVMITTSPDEIPEGITHVAKLNSSGVSQTWTREAFPHEEHSSDRLNWDWGLLEKLVPQLPPSNEKLIQLDEVCIRYGEKKILQHLSWEIRAGERWLLKGPNGSGKSTLISLLIGENPQAYSQKINLFGRKRGTGESIWDVKRPIGFMAPELSRFFPTNQTCRKVILSGLFDTMGLFKKTTPEQESTAESWLKLFDLDQVKDIPIQRLSLAHQRWTLLARALIKKPKVLILDEASQGLDDMQRVLFRETVQRICEHSQVALIYVSHYPEDVPEAVDKVKELTQNS